MTLTPWNPFREVDKIIDRVTRGWGRLPSPTVHRPWTSPRPTRSTSSRSSCRRFASEDVKVAVNQGVLTDGDDPSAKFGAGIIKLKRRYRGRHFQEDFLGDVLGIGVLTTSPTGDPVKHRSVDLAELVPRVGVVLLDANEQAVTSFRKVLHGFHPLPGYT